MVELVSRKTILNANQVFGKFILDLQQAIYNPLNGKALDSLEGWEKEEAEEFEKRKDKVVFTQAQKLFTCSRILCLSKIKSIEKYPHELTLALKELLEKLGYVKICFLMDYNTPWLSQKNQFLPVRKALTYLKKNRYGCKF